MKDNGGERRATTKDLVIALAPLYGILYGWLEWQLEKLPPKEHQRLRDIVEAATDRFLADAKR